MGELDSSPFDASPARESRPKTFGVKVFGEPVELGTVIWRYLSLTKFVSLLDRRALHFARADKLGDRFEGSMSRANLAMRPFLFQAVPEPSRERLADQLSMLRRAQLLRTFLNCWTSEDHESVAMWRQYVGDRDGVAVRSTVGQLMESIGEFEAPILVGRVTYLDYASQPIPEGNLFAPWFHKRLGFAAEHEVRAVVQFMDWTDQNEPISTPYAEEGVYVPVDLARLVNEVRVSPASAPWFVDLVRAVVTKWGLTLETRQSDLLGDPVY